MSQPPRKPRRRIVSVRFIVPVTFPSGAQPLESWRAWAEPRQRPKVEWSPSITSAGVIFEATSEAEDVLVPWTNIASVSSAPSEPELGPSDAL